MALSIVSLLSSTANLLDKNNTDTSSDDISSGLNKRISRFYRGVSGMHDALPVPLELYPVVFVEIENAENNLERLGNSTKRDVEVRFAVYVMTNYGAGSADEGEGREAANMECITATQNIEALLRKNLTLSGTVSWLKTWTTEYNANVGESYYNAVSKINCTAELKIQS